MFAIASQPQGTAMTRLTKAFIKTRKAHDEIKEDEPVNTVINDSVDKNTTDDVSNTVNMFIDSLNTLDKDVKILDNQSAPVDVADANQPQDEAVNMNMKDIEEARRAFLEAQAKANEMQEKLKHLQQAEKVNILARIKDEIKDLGITYEDLKDVIQAPYSEVSGAPGTRRKRRTKEEMEAAKSEEGSSDGRAKVAPKYKNPENVFETWTGRGKKPKWVEVQLAAGKTLESLLIKYD